MKSADEILIEHALATLPDSIAKRKTLLRAVSNKTSTHHPDFKRVNLMLVYLEKHEAQQASLPLATPKKQSRGGKPGRDGHDGHDGHHNGGDGK